MSGRATEITAQSTYPTAWQGQLEYVSAQSFPKRHVLRVQRKHERSSGLAHPNVLRVSDIYETPSNVGSAEGIIFLLSYICSCGWSCRTALAATCGCCCGRTARCPPPQRSTLQSILPLVQL